jgi:putative membrane protein
MEKVLTNEKKMLSIIAILSIVVPVAVAILMVLPENARIQTDNHLIQGLPFFHAVINGSTFILLLLGGVFIKKNMVQQHRLVMASAFILSAVFLVSYVISKLSNDPVPYGGEGAMRSLYFFILITHIALSVPVLPLAMLAIYRAYVNQIEKHKAVVKWTYPIWLYVSSTGVLVYLFMYPYYG